MESQKDFGSLIFFTLGPDPFEVVDQQLFESKKEAENEGWAEFDQIKRKKPSRPPPPRPNPPRPPPPT